MGMGIHPPNGAVWPVLKRHMLIVKRTVSLLIRGIGPHHTTISASPVREKPMTPGDMREVDSSI